MLWVHRHEVFIAHKFVDCIDYNAFSGSHVTLGLSAWVLLVGRIAGRFAVKHPHVKGQTRRIHFFAGNVPEAHRIIVERLGDAGLAYDHSE